MMPRACYRLQILLVPLNLKLPEENSSSSSTASPDSTLVSQSQQPTGLLISNPNTFLAHSFLSDDKEKTLANKKYKLEEGYSENNLIITGYQPVHEEKQLMLNLVVYNIPAKWTNYKLLAELNKWGKVVSVSTRNNVDLAWCYHFTSSFRSSKQSLVQSGSDKSCNKKLFCSRVVTEANAVPLRSQRSQNQVSKKASLQTPSPSNKPNKQADGSLTKRQGPQKSNSSQFDNRKVELKQLLE
ncbi:hypothetical protein RclHR1_10510003 [Rhizophagus clarus]|uniref:Uncharacterized protein n=1 Tax=Rhizophagus clarus TaxID=94130 RepID=A0A2Z6Q6C2_9GLOM|nr:hypothetical protein RclHR1_10510003 [Rhizophagus clarus]